MKAFLIAIFAFGVTAWTAPVEAQTKPDRLMMVVNADNKIAKLDKKTVKSIFLGQTTFWSGDTRVKPFNRTHTGAAGKLFFKSVLGMAPSRYRHHWQKLQLSGQGVEPEIAGTAASLVGKVAGSAGAIGYILESESAAADSRVRLIALD